MKITFVEGWSPWKLNSESAFKIKDSFWIFFEKKQQTIFFGIIILIKNNEIAINNLLLYEAVVAWNMFKPKQTFPYFCCTYLDHNFQPGRT